MLASCKLFQRRLKGALRRQPLTSLANIELGWKGLPVTNTPAYLAYSLVTKKRFYKIGVNDIQLFYLWLTKGQNKLIHFW
jgi:hypothetical protein